jgi:hypothetical protein
LLDEVDALLKDLQLMKQNLVQQRTSIARVAATTAALLLPLPPALLLPLPAALLLPLPAALLLPLPPALPLVCDSALPLVGDSDRSGYRLHDFAGTVRLVLTATLLVLTAILLVLTAILLVLTAILLVLTAILLMLTAILLDLKRSDVLLLTAMLLWALRRLCARQQDIPPLSAVRGGEGRYRPMFKSENSNGA